MPKKTAHRVAARRNPQDAPLRNIRALKARVDRLEKAVDALSETVALCVREMKGR